jgi:hypothetical protein
LVTTWGARGELRPLEAGAGEEEESWADAEEAKTEVEVADLLVVEWAGGPKVEAEVNEVVLVLSVSAH